MIKFLQIALVAMVALLAIAFVVERLIASGTSRAREASSAALKEKLAQRAGHDHWGGGHPIPAPTTSPDSSPNPATLDQEALRAKWIAFYDEFAPTLHDECGYLSPELREIVGLALIGGEHPEPTETQQLELAEFRECLQPARTRLLELVAETENPFRLRELDEFHDMAVVYEGARRFAYWVLRICFQIEAFNGEHTRALESYIAATRILSQYDPLLEPSIAWFWISKALEAGQVNNGQWDRLLDTLAMRRRQEVFSARIKFEAAQISYVFENWKALYRDPDFFKKAPVSYFRTWAYPRLAPALFNHDFDRFNRATARLLDMVDRPYFEIGPELISFYDEFDVESDTSNVKFTRTNPGWQFVVNLSRHEFYGNARNQACIDVMRFAILLDRHHRAHGTYPESLTVFAEHFGGALPVNPLRGDAYVYESTGDTFKLGFTQEEDPGMVALGMDPVRVTYWHDPMGFENVPE